MLGGQHRAVVVSILLGDGSELRGGLGWGSADHTFLGADRIQRNVEAGVRRTSHKLAQDKERMGRLK